MRIGLLFRGVVTGLILVGALFVLPVAFDQEHEVMACPDAQTQSDWQYQNDQAYARCMADLRNTVTFCTEDRRKNEQQDAQLIQMLCGTSVASNG